MTESEVVKRLHSLPAVGSSVRVTYNCEYLGMEPTAKDTVVHKRRKADKQATDRAAGRLDKTWTRLAVVKARVNKGVRSYVAVEIQPEQGVGRRGKYVVSFGVADVMAGVVKIEEA